MESFCFSFFYLGLILTGFQSERKIRHAGLNGTSTLTLRGHCWPWPEQNILTFTWLFDLQRKKPAMSYSIAYTHFIYRFRLYTTLLTPVRGCGVCSLVNGETSVKLKSKLKLDALVATTIDFSEIRTYDSLSANRIF